MSSNFSNFFHSSNEKNEKFFAVVSDTHGSVASWRKASVFMDGADAVLHTGDVLYHGARNPLPGGYDAQALADAINDMPMSVFIARGNCDSDVDQMVIGLPMTQSVVFWWRGKKIFASHGEDYYTFKEYAFKFKADLAVSGHTHIADLKRENGTYFLNPGSTALPKGGRGASMALVGESGIVVISLEGEIMYRESWL